MQVEQCQEEIVLDDSERQPVEVYTRVMGYHRPISFFNPGKLAEHRARRMFTVDLIGDACTPPTACFDGLS